jgi:hypothetical protein
MFSDKMTKKQIQWESDKRLGMHTEVTNILGVEVLSKMKDDEVTQIVKQDPLIIEMGNVSMRKSIKNALRRGQYTSNKLRLVGRLLKVLREKTPNISFDDCLVPGMYREVVNAVREVSGRKGDTMSNPSNALKLGYYLKDLANIKMSLALEKGDNAKYKSAKTFHKLCSKSWKSDVSAEACAEISERNFTRTLELPHPEDLLKLSSYLQELEKQTNITDAYTYRQAVEVCEARLLTYNKRRPGELESVLLSQCRPKNTEPHMSGFFKSLSSFE